MTSSAYSFGGRDIESNDATTEEARNLALECRREHSKARTERVDDSIHSHPARGLFRPHRRGFREVDRVIRRTTLEKFGPCAASGPRSCSSSASKASIAARATRAASRCAFRACCASAMTSRCTRPTRSSEPGNAARARSRKASDCGVTSAGLPRLSRAQGRVAGQGQRAADRREEVAHRARRADRADLDAVPVAQTTSLFPRSRRLRSRRARRTPRSPPPSRPRRRAQLLPSSILIATPSPRSGSAAQNTASAPTLQ